MRELLDLIAKALVDHPAEVELEEIESEGTTVYELKVAEEDLGKIIGKQGCTARAIRTILAAAAEKQRKRVVFEIIEG